MEETFKSIQYEINKLDIVDFYIIKYDNISEKVVIAGSFDFSYYHDLEITFKINTIRMANLNEVKRLQDFSYGYNEGITFCLEDTDYHHIIYISANSLEYKTQKVYYYKKENLKPNEKIADWVQ